MVINLNIKGKLNGRLNKIFSNINPSVDNEKVYSKNKPKRLKNIHNQHGKYESASILPFTYL